MCPSLSRGTPAVLGEGTPSSWTPHSVSLGITHDACRLLTHKISQAKAPLSVITAAPVPQAALHVSLESPGTYWGTEVVTSYWFFFNALSLLL